MANYYLERSAPDKAGPTILRRTVDLPSSAKHEGSSPVRLSQTPVNLLGEIRDPAIFDRLYATYRRQVYGICLRMVTNPSEAEDLTQETFMQVFCKLHMFHGQSKFSTWLHQVTVNIVLMRFRRLKHRVLLATDSRKVEAPPELSLKMGSDDLRLRGVIDRVDLNRAVNQLPSGYKQMFILHDVQGYCHREIALLLNCSVGNSKSQLHKSRLMLRKLLQKKSRSF